MVAVASDTLTRAQKGPARPIETQTIRVRNVQRYLDKAKIPGKAFITEKLCFDGMEEVDLVILGGDQHNVVWHGAAHRIPRTPNVSTSDKILTKQKIQHNL